MKVMDILNATDALQRCGHLSHVEPFGRALQQDVQSRTDNAPGGPEEDEAKGHAEKRVDRKKARQADHQRREDDDQTDERLEDVPESPP